MFKAVTPKRPNPVDVHVGRRIRSRRLTLGLSQEKLASHLGLTFQQVQKYEKGTNRVSASRIQQLAVILRTEPAFFFENAPHVGTNVHSPLTLGETDQRIGFMNQFIASREGHLIAAAFVQISDIKVRQRLIELCNQIVESQRGKPAEASDIDPAQPVAHRL